MTVRIVGTAGAVVLLIALCGCSSPAGRLRPAARGPDRVTALDLNEQGLQHVAAQAWSQAEACFRRALDADPFCGPAHANLGVALLQQGRSYEAAWELQHACQLLPRASQPRVNLALLFERAGQTGSAEEQLRAALKLAPDDIEVIGHLARLHVRQGQRTEETVAWLSAVATQDDDPAWRSWARRELTRTPQDGSDTGEHPWRDE